MTAIRIAAAVALLCLAHPAVGDGRAVAVDDYLGVWETAKDDESWSRIEIYRDDDGLCCGRITYLSSPVYPADGSEGPPGTPRRDRNNPDEKLREHPILGLELMRGFRFDADDGKLVDGRIYDPKSGNEYRCKLTLKDSGVLEVFGYKKVGLVKLGRNTTWTRWTGDATPPPEGN